MFVAIVGVLPDDLAGETVSSYRRLAANGRDAGIRIGRGAGIGRNGSRGGLGAPASSALSAGRGCRFGGHAVRPGGSGGSGGLRGRRRRGPEPQTGGAEAHQRHVHFTGRDGPGKRAGTDDSGPSGGVRRDGREFRQRGFRQRGFRRGAPLNRRGQRRGVGGGFAVVPAHVDGAADAGRFHRRPGLGVIAAGAEDAQRQIVAEAGATGR